MTRLTPKREAEIRHTQRNNVMVGGFMAAELLDEIYALRREWQGTTRYVIIADGDGGACTVATGDIHDELHAFMCFCGKPWEQCETRDITSDIRRIDDDDNWVFMDGKRFSISWDHEDGRLMVYVVSDPR